MLGWVGIMGEFGIGIKEITQRQNTDIYIFIIISRMGFLVLLMMQSDVI